MNPLKIASLSALAAALVGCDSGGSSDGTNVIIERGLAVEMTYPTPNAYLGGDATQSTVRGRIVDLEDGEVSASDLDRISSLTINGASVLFDVDDPTKWSTEVAIEADVNTLDTLMTLEANTIAESSFTLYNHQDYLTNLSGVTYDADNHRALVSDTIIDAIIAIDLTTGLQTIVSSPDVGSGDVLVNPRGLTLDEANNRLYVVDANQDAIFEIDPTTGERTIISSDSAYYSLQDIAYDEANNRLLAVDSSEVIHAISLSDYQRTDFSTLGDGADSAVGLVIDSASNRVLVTDYAAEKLFAVSLADGSDSVVSENSDSAAVNFDYPFSITLDAENNRAIIGDTVLHALVAVDLTSGERTIVTESLPYPYAIIWDSLENKAIVGDSGLDRVFYADVHPQSDTFGELEVVTLGSYSETNTFEAYTVTFDTQNNRLFVPDLLFGLIMQVDLATGNRSVVSDVNTVTGEELDVVHVAYDAATDALYAADRNNQSIIKIDVATGNSETVSHNDTVVSDINFSYLGGGIVLDSVNDRLFVMDTGLDSVLSVDLATGARALISGPDRGDDLNGGNGMVNSFYTMAYDAEADTLYVAEAGRREVIQVDVTTGDRTVISNNDDGFDVDYVFPAGLALDKSNNQLFIADGSNIFAVSRDTEERSVVTGSTVGTGPDFAETYNVAFDEVNQRMFLVDINTQDIFVIDIETGERAIAFY